MFGKRGVLFLCLGLLLGTIPVLAMESVWKIMINIPECRLYLYQNDEIFKTYKVAVGKIDTPSPVGEFQIINKVINPTWYPEGRPAIPPGPNNPLGHYWMGLNNRGYGIHGNSAAWSIGAPVSKGCFRMDNKEIEELYMLIPIGTQVKIIYETIKGKIDRHNQAWLEIYPDIYHRFNLEMKVQQVLAELNWKYQPHQKALACLIGARKQEIMVPRRINIEGEGGKMEIDCFYWNNRVYLNKKLGEHDSVSNTIPTTNPFQEYFPWEPWDMTSLNRFKLEWNEATNTLKVCSLKVRINEEMLDDAARFGTKRNVLINYSKIIKWFEAEQIPKPGWIIDEPEGGRLAGEYYGGELWVDPEKIFINSKEFSYFWEETTWTLNLYYWPE